MDKPTKPCQVCLEADSFELEEVLDDAYLRYLVYRCDTVVIDESDEGMASCPGIIILTEDKE